MNKLLMIISISFASMVIGSSVSAGEFQCYNGWEKNFWGKCKPPETTDYEYVENGHKSNAQVKKDKEASKAHAKKKHSYFDCPSDDNVPCRKAFHWEVITPETTNYNKSWNECYDSMWGFNKHVKSQICVYESGISQKWKDEQKAEQDAFNKEYNDKIRKIRNEQYKVKYRALHDISDYPLLKFCVSEDNIYTSSCLDYRKVITDDMAYYEKSYYNALATAHKNLSGVFSTLQNTYDNYNKGTMK